MAIIIRILQSVKSDLHELKPNVVTVLEPASDFRDTSLMSRVSGSSKSTGNDRTSRVPAIMKGNQSECRSVRAAIWGAMRSATNLIANAL